MNNITNKREWQYPIRSKKTETRHVRQGIDPGFDFPAQTRSLQEASLGGQQAQEIHPEITIHDDHEKPKRQNARDGESEKTAEPAQGIGERIEDSPQFAFLLQAPGEEAVRQVGKFDQKVDDPESDEIGVFQRAEPVAKNHQSDEYRGENDAADGYQVRYGHRI